MLVSDLENGIIIQLRDLIRWAMMSRYWPISECSERVQTVTLLPVPHCTFTASAKFGAIAPQTPKIKKRLQNLESCLAHPIHMCTPAKLQKFLKMTLQFEFLSPIPRWSSNEPQIVGRIPDLQGRCVVLFRTGDHPFVNNWDKANKRVLQTRAEKPTETLALQAIYSTSHKNDLIIIFHSPVNFPSSSVTYSLYPRMYIRSISDGWRTGLLKNASFFLIHWQTGYVVLHIYLTCSFLFFFLTFSLKVQFSELYKIGMFLFGRKFRGEQWKQQI